MTGLDSTDFWQPEFDIVTREDGSILMRQPDPLPDHLPTLADYLDQWADATPDHPWLAQRENGGDWRRITYAQARDMAMRIGASLLDMGLGPDRPLLILSSNSLEHALLGAACFCVGIPYAPLGRTVIGGLLASTALTLFVVPFLYLLINQAKEARQRTRDSAL